MPQQPSCQPTSYAKSSLRHDWQHDEIAKLFDLPFNNLLYAAHCQYLKWFDSNQIQLSTLVNIKQGGCPEDCAYCPQSNHHQTTPAKKMMSLTELEEQARRAKERGASRFCMGAAFRELKDRDMKHIIKMLNIVKELHLESCLTLGMLTAEQSKKLKKAGLDYYNHNLDSSESFYKKIISTRCYQDRLQTLKHVRDAGIHVCCGGIVGLGEDVVDRINMLQTLATMPKHPESVPINLLVQVKGTPLYGTEKLDPFEFVKMIAVTRILMPSSWVRLSAGRAEMSDELQALCFFAGANSIFYGDMLLTTDNPKYQQDQQLFKRLGLRSIP